jgi:hypothetical protein
MIITTSSAKSVNDMAWIWMSDTRGIRAATSWLSFSYLLSQGDATGRFAPMALPWALIGPSLRDWGETPSLSRQKPDGTRYAVSVRMLQAADSQSMTSFLMFVGENAFGKPSDYRRRLYDESLRAMITINGGEDFGTKSTPRAVVRRAKKRRATIHHIV